MASLGKAIGGEGDGKAALIRKLETGIKQRRKGAQPLGGHIQSISRN